MTDQNDPAAFVEGLSAFHVRGLYGPDLTLLAEDAKDASRLYHTHLPGWDGVVLSVAEGTEEETAAQRADLRAQIEARLVELDIAASVTDEVDWQGVD